MAHHVEPMDVDCLSEFDNKENSYHHSNVLPCTEKGYEELDVSELNMKLRYSVTPASSPMSKSCTTHVDKTFDIDSLNVNEANLTRSLNSTMTKNDSVIKSLKSLPLQALPSEQFVDGNGNPSITRQLDIDNSNITLTITETNDIDENLSLPSSSSSALQTPATTPTKDLKNDGSPIMRGLKSVLNMFRASQSPIPPSEDEIKPQDLSPEHPKPEVIASTPIAAHKTKDGNTSRKSSPLKESIVFNDDLEKEISWKDETTVLFSDEKIPIHKLFLPPTIKLKETLEKESQKTVSNDTVEYMDVSYNETLKDKTMADLNDGTLAGESDSEFVDCETTINKTEPLDDKIEGKTNIDGCSTDAHNLNKHEDVVLNEDKPKPDYTKIDFTFTDGDKNDISLPSDYSDYSKETTDILSELEKLEATVSPKSNTSDVTNAQENKYGFTQQIKFQTNDILNEEIPITRKDVPIDKGLNINENPLEENTHAENTNLVTEQEINANITQSIETQDDKNVSEVVPEIKCKSNEETSILNVHQTTNTSPDIHTTVQDIVNESNIVISVDTDINNVEESTTGTHANEDVNGSKMTLTTIIPSEVILEKPISIQNDVTIHSDKPSSLPLPNDEFTNESESEPSVDINVQSEVVETVVSEIEKAVDVPLPDDDDKKSLVTNEPGEILPETPTVNQEEFSVQTQIETHTTSSDLPSVIQDVVTDQMQLDIRNEMSNKEAKDKVDSDILCSQNSEKVINKESIALENANIASLNEIPVENSKYKSADLTLNVLQPDITGTDKNALEKAALNINNDVELPEVVSMCKTTDFDQTYECNRTQDFNNSLNTIDVTKDNAINPNDANENQEPMDITINESFNQTQDLPDIINQTITMTEEKLENTITNNKTPYVPQSLLVPQETQIIPQEIPTVPQETPIQAQEIPMVTQETPILAQDNIPTLQQETPILEQEISIATQETPVLTLNILIVPQETPILPQEEVPSMPHEITTVPNETSILQESSIVPQEKIVEQQEISVVPVETTILPQESLNVTQENSIKSDSIQPNTNTEIEKECVYNNDTVVLNTSTQLNDVSMKEATEGLPDIDVTKNVTMSESEIIHPENTINDNIEVIDVPPQDFKANDPIVDTVPLNEEIIVSENNSPYVSLMAGLDKTEKVEQIEDTEIQINATVNVPSSPPITSKGYNFNFDEIENPINTTVPSSPPIKSKGYNFNFDEMDDPFASKTKMRMTPPLDTPTKPLKLETEDKKGGLARLPANRRKSQPVERKKPAPIKKKFNASFDAELSSKMTVNNVEIKTEVSDDYSNADNISGVAEVKHKDSQSTNNLNIILTKVDDKAIENTVVKEFDINEENKNSIDSITSVTNDQKTSLEQSTYYSAGTSSTDSFKTKNVFNLPEIDDINFNPFASKSKIRQSPQRDMDENPFSTRTKILNSPDTSVIVPPLDDVKNVEAVTVENRLLVNKVDSADKMDTEAMEKDISNVSATTSSSKATNNQNLTTREINTEDEDTEEGPFLEAEDVIDKMSDFDDGNVDMMQFNELPTHAPDDNADGELFIDAEAYEFLLNKNQCNMVAESGKESLFLKFDPLFANRISSDGVLAALNKVQRGQSTPTKPARPSLRNEASPIAGPSLLNATYECDNNVSQENNEDLNVTVAKPMMVVTPAVNPTVTPRTKSTTPTRSNRHSITFTSPAIALIDGLLSMSSNNSFMGQETTITQPNREQHEADLALTQLRELLAEKEISVCNLRSESKELQDRLSTMESKIKVLETDGHDKLKRINELNERLVEKTKINKSMAAVVEEYERTIASLIAETEQDKKRNAEERMRLINERDEQTAHLASMEVSFSDLHSKYEKSKQVILACRANEEAYKKSINDFEENLNKAQSNYELLKQHATSKLNHANQELEKINKSHEAEVVKFNALIKRKELHITSLEETLTQKTKANEELTAICDELINKVG